MPNEEDRDRYAHPSYVLVGISRIQGGIGRLFGSSLPKHDTAVRLRVTPAVREHSLGRDWYFPETVKPFIEVDLSANQFAEMITSMNMGSGVTGTLRYLEGLGTVADPPDDHKLEAEKVRDSYRRDVRKLATEAKGARAKVAGILDKKSLSKADREAILEQFVKFEQHVTSNAPFMMESFEEAAEKVVVAAKAEIDAFVTHNVMAEGIRSLAAKAAAVPALPPAGVEDPETHPELYECAGCSAKPGTPVLCARCNDARAAAGPRWAGARPGRWRPGSPVSY